MHKEVTVKAANLLLNLALSAWALLHVYYTLTTSAFQFPLPQENS